MRILAASLHLALLVSACSVNPVPKPANADSTPVTDGTLGDTTLDATDATGTNVAKTDSAADSATTDAADTLADTPTDTPTDAPGKPGDFGFVYRIPQQHKGLKCSNAPPGIPDTMDAWDQDWLCQITGHAKKPYVYVQATPKSCQVFLGPVPNYDAQAWVSDGTVAQQAGGATYDHGGGHNNDAAEFTWDGSEWKLYHSSFGFGFRKCQPMDCAVESKGGKLVNDGCTPERKVPAVCVPIEKNGSYKALVDAYKKCDGDPNKK
jgi:hypothetical protein